MWGHAAPAPAAPPVEEPPSVVGIVLENHSVIVAAALAVAFGRTGTCTCTLSTE